MIERESMLHEEAAVVTSPAEKCSLIVPRRLIVALKCGGLDGPRCSGEVSMYDV